MSAVLDTVSNTQDDDLAEDMLEGAAQIACHIGKTVRQTNWLLEKKQIPAFKIGNTWHMRRSTFRRHIEQLEAAAQGVPANQ